MPVHVFFFDVQGKCTDPSIRSLETLIGPSGFWLNQPFSLGSVYMDMKRDEPIWCIVAYESVYLAGPVNVSFAHIYPLLDALCNTRTQEKMIHLTNFMDLLFLYQTQDSMRKNRKLLLPRSLDGIRVV